MSATKRSRQASAITSRKAISTFTTGSSKAAANRTLAKLLRDELYQLVRMYRIQFSTTPNRPHQAFAEHHRILDAIAERDGELAELLMRRHIACFQAQCRAPFQGRS
jgi:Transcriptional regulators